MAAKQSTELDDNLLWYKDAIIYELHIKAFKDGNGDGIGDFRGLLEKLDYLQDLGVTAIWLLPFYPSPLRDDGYDIMDYYTVNPSYGTLRDFKKLLKEAKSRGLRVITELVINHTSDQHPWFQRARRAPAGSSERDYYVWNDTADKYGDTRIIFQDFEVSNWTYDSVAQAYFWHRFYAHQPDLNFDHEPVQQEVFKMLDYWIDLGVDGFRLDAVPYLFEREGTNCENLPETHVFLKKLRKHVDEKKPGIMLLAEANMWPEDSASYYGDGDECHMNFHFPIMPRMFMALRMEDRYPIIDILDQTPAIPDNCQWGLFLRNHDELTLEMVTDEERDYMYKVYTKDPKARINLGIRHRLAPLLENDRRKIELMNHLLLSLPGTPVIYYGDEIGMGDNFYLGDRDGVRTPMQWSPDRNAGFSDANPQQLYLPVILDPEYRYEAVNVETQQRNSNSLLWWMKRHFSMRKSHRAFSRGNMNFLYVDNSKILAFTRTYKDETLLIISNLSRFSQSAEVDLSHYSEAIPVELFSRNRFPRVNEPTYHFTLGPYAYQWFLLEKPREYSDEFLGENQQPVFSIAKWSQLTGKNARTALEKHLGSYLNTCRWFGGKSRTIRSISIADAHALPITDGESTLLILEVSYNEGLDEYYQLPVSFIPEGPSVFFRSKFQQSVIFPINLGGEEGYLYDAMYSEPYRSHLFSLMAKPRKKEEGNGLIGRSVTGVRHYYKEHKKTVTSRILGAEQSNTSVIYDKQYFFKIYRKLERMVNPDVEVTRYLSETAEFANIPKYAGELVLKDDKATDYMLGMMLELVDNQGDAWEYMNDAIDRYYERVSLGQEEQRAPALKGSLMKPVDYDKIPDILQSLIGGAPAERARLLGLRTAEMHIALAAHPEVKNFEPEAFSLHYQRSLYSSLQTLVRTTYQTLDRSIKQLPDPFMPLAEQVRGMKKDVLQRFKSIYAHKIDALKIRTHGDYHLGQVLFTGRDFVILDFEGEPARSYSERRLKRSPLRDVAGMLRSFHYAAYNSLFHVDDYLQGNADYLETWAEQWNHYMSGFYLQAYLEKTSGHPFIPSNEGDFNILIQTFLLEKAIYELNYELNNRPGWSIIPMKGILYVMEKFTHED